MPNQAPVVTGGTSFVDQNWWIRASSLFTATDPDGDPITQYQFVDPITLAGNSYFWINGATFQPTFGSELTVSAADLANVWVHGSANSGDVDFLEVRAFDNSGSVNNVSAYAIINLTTQGPTSANVINGGSGNDTLQGTPGDETFHGNDGNDTLIGNYGADALFGENGNDVLVGGGPNPNIQLDVGGLMNGLLGSDWNPVGIMDTTGDGRGDILWSRPGGTSAIWTANGFTAGPGSDVVHNSAGMLSALGLDWTATGFADFNGDGKGDMLWSRASTGEAVIIQLDGSLITVAAQLNGAIGANWGVKATGDFDNDGKADLLWLRDNLNGTNSVAVWNMDGFTIKNSSVNFGLTPIDPAQGLIGSTNQIAGVGDLNNDGRDDILWRDVNTGNASVWLVTGANSITPLALSNQQTTDWAVRGVSDFNGDGKADILWHNTTTNAVEVWMMNGATRASVTTLPSIGSDWRIAGLSDGTGDGIPDVYWTKDGQVAIWEMGAMPEDVMTGGAGRDTFQFESRADTGNVITDFQAGTGGDVLGMSAVMAGLGLTGQNGLTTGVVRAVQDGAATEVQVDMRPGSGAQWATFATLQNTTAAALTPDNWAF